jgi:predicted secreted hydrolase
MWRWIVIGSGIVAIFLLGFSLIEVASNGDMSASAIVAVPQQDISGFPRANAPYSWQFPQDYGAHPEFQTEWWYYTGNLFAETGERFGFQFTIFRRAITPEAMPSDSEWRSNQVYLAHFTVSDINGEQFYHAERFSRGGADLAGAVSEPRYHVWLEDWAITAQNDAATLTTIQADARTFAINLTLEQVKPPALHGENGLSPKSGGVGNASYYYSLSRLITSGTVTIGGKAYQVEGTTWKDHEFATQALGADARGWDWFGLIFDDERELMVGQIRRNDGSREPAFGGLLINPDGSTRYLPSSAFIITPINTWTSPHTGATYPSGWDIAIDAGEIQLNFTVTPALLDQELYGANTEYWEGAVDISGDVTGYGYAELTGYVNTMQGRF